MSSGAPLETGQTVRYPSVSLLCVSTEDGFQYKRDTHELIEGPNKANITINRGRTIVSGHLTRVAVTEAEIEWNVPNVNENNNTLIIDLQDALGVHVDYVMITVPVGFYNCVRLIRRIEQLLNANSTIVSYFTGLAPAIAGPYFEVYLADQNGDPYITSVGSEAGTLVTNTPVVGIRLTEDAIAGARFNIVSSQAVSSLTGLPSYRNDLTDMLGWTPSDGGSRGYVTYVGGYASFQYTPYIDLVSRTLTKNQKVSDADSSENSLPNKLARIYFDNEHINKFEATATYDASGVLLEYDDNVIGTTPFTFRREFKFPKQILWNTEQNIDIIELQVLDYKGQLLPITSRTVETELLDDEGNPYEPPRYRHDVPDFAEFRFTLQLSEN
jgi:hypothetical protein